MNTIILNGSPKGDSQNSNSRIFAEEFVRNMINPCEIRCIAKAYEQTHAFDKEIVKKLGKPYELTKFHLLILAFIKKVGLDNVGWHKFLRENNALDKRLDRPFL